MKAGKRERLYIVLEPEASNEAQVYIEEFERTIRTIECELLASTDTSHIIQELLRHVGMFYKADRAYIIEVDWDMALGSNTYEWYTDGVFPQKSDRQNIDLEQLPLWKSAFVNKSPIILEHIENLHTSGSQEYILLKQYDITALIAVPLNKKLSGFLCVDNPKRFKRYSSLLQALSYVVTVELTELQLLKAARLKQGIYSKVAEQEVVLNFFGGLEIVTPMGQMSEDDIKSTLGCKLIAYLYLNRKRTLAARDIADFIWPNQPVDNPNTAVKRVVYRCRKTLSCIEQTPLIVSVGGGYELNRDLIIRSDTTLLEQYYTKIRGLTTPYERMEIYRKAIVLYKEAFLPNHNHDQWLMPKASYYHLLFLDMVKRCLLDLYKLEMHIEVYRLADYTLAYEPEDNELNFHLVESLFRMNATAPAYQHYLNTKGLYSPEQEEKLKKLFRLPT